MNILDFSICIYLDPDWFLWIFFPFCCKVKVSMNSTAVGKKMIPKAHQLNICCILSFTEGVLLCLLKPGSRSCKGFQGNLVMSALHVCPDTFSLFWNSQFLVCFLRATTAAPVHLTFHFYPKSTTRVHQNIYYELSEPGTVLQLYIFLFFLYLTALSLNVDVSGETGHSSVHPKWRK